MGERVFRFGPFELRPERGRLSVRGVPVALGSRALAILALLAERAGELVSVSEIASAVWPNLFVQDNNLRVHLTAIRRVLRAAGANDVEIVNVPGRGYRLHAHVTKEYVSSSETEPKPELRPVSIPLPTQRLIGRAEFVARVVASVESHRLVTLVGAGGIGKTSVALAGLRALSASKLTCFVDLTNCASVENVVAAMASALQIPMGSDASPVVLVERLRDAELILLLDNCEHLIDVIASVAERVLQSCARVTLLATSREPLRIPGEMLLYLQPLSVPLIDDNARAVAESPAARLFVERAEASAGLFSITETNAGQVAAICRSLDGLPLALELAAAAVPVVGVDALSRGLTQRLSQAALGRRTLARHETLDAMLDWSFELLTPAERTAFAALGCFRGSFDLPGALQVVAPEGRAAAEAAEVLLKLSLKSLVVVEHEPRGVTYRLLETTKAYARRKLAASGGADQAERRHAEWVLGVLERAREDWVQLERTDWWDRYGAAIDDVRAALVWTLGETGNARLGIGLTVASAPLWVGLAQFAEYNRWLEQALATLTALGEDGGAEEIQLQIGLCVLLFNEKRPGERFVRAANAVLRIGETIGDATARATGLWLLAGYRQIVADHPGALALACRMLQPDAPTADPDLYAFAQRVIGLMTFRTGQLEAAALIGANLLSDLTERTDYGGVLRYDHYCVARSNHALTLALQGRLDAAIALVEDAVRDGARLRNPATFCYLLSSAACPVALWVGDDDLARHYAHLLAREALDNGFTYMGELATCFARSVAARSPTVAQPSVADGLPPPLPHDKDVLITGQVAWCDEDAVARAEAVEPHWATAEIFRARGEMLLGSGNAVDARTWFTRALAIAEEQGSWLWALRAATSLARLMPPSEADPLVRAALSRVDRSATSRDVAAARLLLMEAAGSVGRVPSTSESARRSLD